MDINHTAKFHALALVEEIIAGKTASRIVPAYALHSEVNALVAQALDELVAEGSIVLRPASINRIPAYEIPQTPVQPPV